MLIQSEDCSQNLTKKSVTIDSVEQIISETFREYCNLQDAEISSSGQDYGRLLSLNWGNNPTMLSAETTSAGFSISENLVDFMFPRSILWPKHIWRFGMTKCILMLNGMGLALDHCPPSWQVLKVC